VEIRSVPFDHPDAVTLVEALQQHYFDVYGYRDPKPVDPVEFVPPRGEFLVVHLDDEPVACGGWRAHDSGDQDFLDGDAELKRGYLVPKVRGSDVAMRLLTEIEGSAVRAGRRRGLVDTRSKQRPAIGLFVRAGYRTIPNFGVWRGDPNTVCLAKDLT
jgi:GNAT superfamily N-acetyltransferase